MQREGEGWGRGKRNGVHKGSFNSWLRRLYESSWVISAVLWLQIQKHDPHPNYQKRKDHLKINFDPAFILPPHYHCVMIFDDQVLIRSWYVLNMFWWLGDPAAGCFLRRAPWCALRTARRPHRVEPFGPESSARTRPEGSTGDDDDVRCVHWCTLYTQCNVM